MFDMEHYGLDGVAALARSMAEAPVSPEVHADGRNRLMAAAARRSHAPRASRRPKVAIMFGLAATFAAAAGFYLVTRPLRYDVQGGLAYESRYVSALAGSPAEVRFSDGSEIEAVPGSRLRIDEPYSNGARVFVERGTATAQVKHGARSNWLFVAGPFEVRVTGTKLTLTWDPWNEEVELVLHEGSVEVESPFGQGTFPVHAGQRFRGSLFERTMSIEDIPLPGTSTSVAPAVGPVGSNASLDTADGAVDAVPNPAQAWPQAWPVERRRGVQSSSAKASTSAPRRDSWGDMVMRGEFGAVVEVAEGSGVDKCLSSCSANDLRALADAARYTDRTTLAEKCLIALRDRFVGNRQSAAAAFLLGRTSESRGSMSNAQHWYEVYGSESPSGEFAADALAGRMRVVSASSGAAAAKPLALEYLRRYPTGVHADAAHRIAGLN